MLKEQIDTALKAAMKAKDQKLRVATLRLINAAIKDRDIAARGEDRCEGANDEEILGILTKMVKQREESAAAFEKGCRPELAEQERAEIDVIREFLPRQLSEDEIKVAVKDVIDEYDASGLKDMGKCMGALKERFHGSMDFGAAGKMMKDRLS
ncbi:GatB/YqeY domain-containing protein [Hyphococcus flavus]|uniref:GatB/YqeY domain-containing protein n=1 Tax=Hyphococcus flavus TaxID=1866326 RepID=A0AAE9ZD39_9PROT|nr:GatB/YqeY domain-containing protein [Hyphococcus flavus]WDI30757.1 GatB/YqeY domain-containing protein [Hyphococcus flavus]